ncbi:Na/Pi cotransporter family protein [Aquabacterium sp. A08]|uniref:Na/Pi cotransporter family protein n=1 Tax=Aquabacterium sp. A08 TaxID=2718532 RepID=UPI00142157A0|nr:Na/Pi symporter [Aquabacterium sp. A08]NIC43678.1 Na/Pi cotransporter family protein [Aquabacterium sp. A08]
MQEMLFPFVGGLGLFLIGMMLLSQGLVAFGGDLLKRALSRFTGTPTAAVVSGALATVVVQSSSATTVTLIGFVSAGLISFSQAIGVLIGASLGNTATGWIVAGLGLKVNLGFYTLPLIGLGALLKLTAKGRLAEFGLALAGFGTMFTGLNTLQDGMRGLATVFDLASLPSGGYGASVLILLFGLALTAVLQSSTAAIATTLTALHTQTINFDQAAALVVGAAIGTTLTGALVTIGGTLHAKRTAVAYILFNAVAGALAIALLPLLFWVIAWLGTHAGLDAGAMSLAAFHTLFIALGVVLFLPVVPRFAGLVERLLPDKGEPLTQRLDDSLLALPAVALEAAQRALEQTTEQLLALYSDLLTPAAPAPTPGRLQALGRSLDTAYAFVSRIELRPDDAAAAAQRIAQLHAIDHLLRFRTRLDDLLHAGLDLSAPGYAWALSHNRQMLALARQGLAARRLDEALPELEVNALGLTELSRQMRHALLDGSDTPSGPAADLLAKADAYRWLERTGHHIWRIGHYLARGRPTGAAAPDRLA